MPLRKKSKIDPNTRPNIFTIMYANIAKEFSNVPRPTEITVKELFFYYDIMKMDIIKNQKETVK